MSIPPRQHEGSTGVLHVVRQSPSRTMRSDVGRASGSMRLLLGVSQDDMDIALQVLTAQAHHEIPHVTVTKEFLRTLGS